MTRRRLVAGAICCKLNHHNHHKGLQLRVCRLYQSFKGNKEIALGFRLWAIAVWTIILTGSETSSTGCCKMYKATVQHQAGEELEHGHSTIPQTAVSISDLEIAMAEFLGMSSPRPQAVQSSTRLNEKPDKET